MMKKTAAALLILYLIFLLANIPVTTKQGVNYEVRTLSIPLYIKIAEFADRDYWYRRMSKEILAGATTDEEKALKAFSWTKSNIHKTPSGFDVIDDHILNIIIRRYGMADQASDVFTTLCSYGGVPALWDFFHDKSGNIEYPIALAKIRGKWRVFDCNAGIFFRTAARELASIDDIAADSSILKTSGIWDIYYEGVPCGEFYGNLKPPKDSDILRPDKQKPGGRLLYELKKFIPYKGRL